MVEPEIRRASDPRIVRKIHSAIKKTCEQKQSPIFERIHKALNLDKVQITRSRIETQLKYAIRDGLIIENNGNRSAKGFGPGDAKTSYRIPTQENYTENYGNDGHDWYCWVCHREGEVFLCTRCPRVIHKKCAELSTEDLLGDFVCYCCKDLDSTKQYGKKEIQELAKMLGYTVDRMKSKCEELWKSPNEEVHSTYRLFVYQDYNLNDLEKKVKRKEFDSLAKFHYEIEWIFHNAVIYYGGDNKLTELARMVVLDGQNELSQIDICSECYIRSNVRMKNWFSIPCKPVHRIVYAKLGSDPPWPAKVLRESEDKQSIDVRFFGPPYQRAWIPKRNIYDLDEKPVMKKRSKALVHAEDELKVYLRLMASSRNTQSKKAEKSEDEEDSNSEEEIDDDEEENEEEEAEDDKPPKTPKSTGVGAVGSRRKIKQEDDEEDEDEEEEEGEEEEDEIDDDSDYSDDEYVPDAKRRKKSNKQKKNKEIKESKERKTAGGRRGRRKGYKNKGKLNDDTFDSSKSKARPSKAEQRFRELQEKRMLEFAKKKNKNFTGNNNNTSNNTEKHRSNTSKNSTNNNNNNKQDVSNKNNSEAEPGDDVTDLAKQMKMTDDYKMIEKLQERVRSLEKSLEQTKSDYESAQADLESTRIELATERQKSKRLQEQVEKGAEVNEEKLRNELMSKRQEEIDASVEEERKRNELEFQSRLNEALSEERSKADAKLQESLEKERVNLEGKVKMMAQREREEMQRNFDHYKGEIEMKNKRTLEETARKYKIEADEMANMKIQDNIRRMQAETGGLLAAAKKKSWCSNCTKEAFYHCCWNTNYCSTDCQRHHWLTHKYQCSREMMTTCRSCQQRQNFPGGFPQVPPK